MDKALEVLRKNVYALIEKAKWSQSELARAIGWSPQQLNDCLKRHEPGLEKIEELARAFDLQPWQLLQPDAPKIDDNLTSIQREIILLIRRMNDSELDPFLKMLRAWPGNTSFKAREQKKQA